MLLLGSLNQYLKGLAVLETLLIYMKKNVILPALRKKDVSYLLAWASTGNANLVAKKCRISVVSAFRARRKLFLMGLISKDNAITDAGKKLLELNVGLGELDSVISPIVRMHNIMVELELQAKPIDWDMRRARIVELRPTSWKSWRLSPKKDGEGGLLTECWLENEGVRVRTTPRRLLLTFDWIFAQSAEGAAQELDGKLARVVPLVEAELNVRLRKRGIVRAFVKRSEFASMGCPMAKALLNLGFQEFTVWDEKGQKRWWVDKSLGPVESEAGHSIRGLDDSATVAGCLKAWLDEPESRPEVLREQFAELKGLVKESHEMLKSMQVLPAGPKFRPEVI